MKKSITSKITASYLLIILISQFFIGTLFTFTAGRYVERREAENLRKNASVIVRILRTELHAERRFSDTRIQQLIREAIKKNIRSQNISFVVMARDLSVLYPKNSNQTDDFITAILPKIEDEFRRGGERSARIRTDGMDYAVHIVPAKVNFKEGNLNWIVLYSPMEQLHELRQGMTYILFIYLLFVGVAALVVGILIARSIAKPIILLKKRTESLSRRDYDSKVEINTGDELELLADTIDKMAEELKEYDIAQKKFLQNASHELKTPLMSIQGYAEGIKDGVFEDNNQALDVIVEESTRLKGIVEELIYLSKLETMENFYKFTKEDISDVIEKSIEKVKSLAIKSDIKINTSLQKGAVLNIDRDKFTQALINLLGNCIRHSKSQINVSTSYEGDHLVIRVSDDGEGFGDEDLKNVFERFYKGKKGDTGLGLSITKVIIEKHGGVINVFNGKGGGAEFVITLPGTKGQVQCPSYT